MAHNINSMAYYGDTPWHTLGKKIPLRATAAEMIVAAGLNWKVEARGARGAAEDKKGRFSKYEILRLPNLNQTEEILLGVVKSHNYVPLQNSEAFKFFDPVIGESKAVFETAGALGHGECIWALAKMPEVMEVVPGDHCMRYLLLSNRHDGKGAVTVKFTSVRVVCQNTLMMALKDGQNAYKVKHSKIMSERLSEVGKILGMAREVYEECGELFKRMAKTSLAKNMLDEFLEAIYPRTKKQKENKERSEKWEQIDKLLNERDDLLLPKVEGTLWAAYNAVTYLEDYRQLKMPEEPYARLNRIWFGAGAKTKLDALNAARQIVTA